MKATAESRRLRRSWVAAYARHVNRVQPAPRVGSFRRGGWEHVSGPLRRVLEGLARAGGLSL
jgi:hypothetical protein